jgi:integration host factor subunit beta
MIIAGHGGNQRSRGRLRSTILIEISLLPRSESGWISSICASFFPSFLGKSNVFLTPDTISGGIRAVMTKADLIEEVSRLAELTRKDSEIIVETIFESVVSSLRAGDKIEVRGFGSFRTRSRKPRVGRNPKTGARVEVAAKKIPYFKPSKELKDLINHDHVAAPAAEAK